MIKRRVGTSIFSLHDYEVVGEGAVEEVNWMFCSILVVVIVCLLSFCIVNERLFQYNMSCVAHSNIHFYHQMTRVIICE